MEKSTLLIGIDGGATKVSAWEIVYNEAHNTFSLGKANATKSYREIDGFIPDFVPADLNTQLHERDNEPQLSANEKQQAAVYVEACALAVKELTEKVACNNVLIGIGMPGLKTANQRGIAVVANGPRMVDYADCLEGRLKQLSINLLAPIKHLGSDADYCGVGENYSEHGMFRNVQNAYYLGGGTGVADALKLDGHLLPFDRVKDWMAKTWEMKSTEGISLERITSVSGIQNCYAGFAHKTVEALNEAEIYPLQISERAKLGEEAAVKTFNLVNQNLSLLLYERIVTLYAGSKALFEFVNPNKPELAVEHPYLGKVFDAIIVGQRLGDLFEDKTGSEMVKKPVLQQLSQLIQTSTYLPAEVKQYYADLSPIVCSSQLREAPALGAGIDAFLSK